MLCDDCRERDATVTLTHALKGEVSVTHLCQRCAAERGLETTSGTPFKNMIADYLPAVQQQAAMAQAELLQCAFCSMTLKDFRETGRLGCARCYSTFEQSLRALLRRVHGNARHVGRAYEPPPLDLLRESTALGELREQLRRAIAQEEFETAARIRDQIREME
jgi:protein arginine kinase activator